MARKRKNRTHLKGAAPPTAGTDGAPKSFIIKHGQVGSSIAQLVRDIRKVMEPNTASRLRVRAILVIHKMKLMMKLMMTRFIGTQSE